MINSWDGSQPSLISHITGLPMTKKGFFTFTTAKGLFLKLEHDLAEVQRKPSDPYTAFNFFVTAEHLLDWLYPGKANELENFVEKVSPSYPLSVISPAALSISTD